MPCLASATKFILIALHVTGGRHMYYNDRVITNSMS